MTNFYANRILEKILHFIYKCGQSAFPGWTTEQIRRALVYAGANTRLQIFVTEGRVDGLCVWDIQESEKNIHVTAFAGNREQINYMRGRWKREYPTYTISYLRGQRQVQLSTPSK